MPIPPLRLHIQGPSRASHPAAGTPSEPPRRARRGPRKTWWAHWFFRVVAIILAVGAISSVVVVAWVSQALPDPNKLNSRNIAESTKIYARDGSTLLYEIHGDQKRTLINLDEVSPAVKNATISIEDKDFYKHSGVSLRGIFRSILVDVLSGSRAQGGSTITQQLVKNSILTREKSISRKVKEVILSYQIERRFSKDQILKLYFNEIPYGSSAYGIEAAAQTYFGKHAKDLDLPESALLAAMAQAPSYYSPTGNHRDDLISRQQLVLSTMAGEGYISQEQAGQAKAVDILARINPYRDRVVAPHFVFYVRDLLVQKYGALTAERGGLRVVTTLDANMQKIAEEEVAAGAARNDKKGAGNAALVAIDPHTGQILAMVGSRDYFDTAKDGNFNVATAVRNPGSSFKPIVYLTAFTKGYTPDTILFDLKTDFGPDGSGKNFAPNNYDGKEHGPLKMRQTLAGSLNIPAVKTLYLAGIPQTIAVAQKLGYNTIDPAKVGLALAIGGGGIRLLDHVNAFAALANDGSLNPSTPFVRIEDHNGKLLEQYQKKETRAVETQYVRQLVDIMSDNNARAFVFGSRSPLILSNRPVAAKTGTTNDFKDGWTVGFTPSLAAGVWVGNNNNAPMKSGQDGVVVAGPIWHAFMERALKGTPVEQFKKPAPSTAKKPILLGRLQGDTTVSVDAATGKKIPDSCLAEWPASAVKEVKVKDVHTILWYLSKDDPNGAAPTRPQDDPMFVRWEKPIQEWAKKNNYVTKAPDEESCSLMPDPQAPAIFFSAPNDRATVSATSITVTATARNFTPVSGVQFSLDGSVVASAPTAPYSVSLDLAGVSNGFHTITATGVDAAGAPHAASITVNVLSQAATTAYFISPSSKATVASGSFPQSVSVYAYDSSGVSTVTLYIENPDGTTAVVDQASTPSDSTVALSWSTTPPGSYKLFFIIKTKKNKSLQSDKLPVTVT